MAANNFSDAFKEMMQGENELLVAAVQIHNMYEAYIRAGFTEDQAIKLIIGIITGSNRNTIEG